MFWQKNVGLKMRRAPNEVAITPDPIFIFLPDIFLPSKRSARSD